MALAEYLRRYQSPFNRTKVQLMGNLIGPTLRGKRVLDYGAGAGYMAVCCARRGAEVALVEAEATALRTARYYAEREGVASRCRFLSFTTLPPALERERFDLVVAKDVIEHVEDDLGLLRRLARVQEAGGRLLSTQSAFSLNFVLEGAYERWWKRRTAWCGWDPTHVRFYTPFSLRRLLRAAGYRAVRWRGVFIVPYDLPSWAVLLRRRIEFPWLRYVDLTLGRHFPLNRCGWDVIVLAVRDGRPAAGGTR